LKKRLAETGLIAQYQTSADFALSALMILALAYVPVDRVSDSFDALSDASPDDLQPVLDWFEDSYVGRRRPNGTRRPPLFPIAMWSCYERVLHDQDRTNNHAEAAHRAMQTELQMDHPSIWRLIDALRRVQKKRDQQFEQMVSGAQPPQKRRKYRNADERIRLLVSQFAQRPILEYLRGIAHNFEIP
jgi:hypothetical protein